MSGMSDATVDVGDWPPSHGGRHCIFLKKPIATKENYRIYIHDEDNSGTATFWISNSTQIEKQVLERMAVEDKRVVGAWERLYKTLQLPKTTKKDIQIREGLLRICKAASLRYIKLAEDRINEDIAPQAAEPAPAYMHAAHPQPPPNSPRRNTRLQEAFMANAMVDGLVHDLVTEYTNNARCQRVFQLTFRIPHFYYRTYHRKIYQYDNRERHSKG